MKKATNTRKSQLLDSLVLPKSTPRNNQAKQHPRKSTLETLPRAPETNQIEATPRATAPHRDGKLGGIKRQHPAPTQSSPTKTTRDRTTPTQQQLH